MGKLIKFLFVLLLGAVGAVLALAAREPDHYRISRTIIIDAPPAEAFALVNDFHKWDAWSPWAKIDPNATERFEGPKAGKGAKFHWAGNAEVGEGNMTIETSETNSVINIKLQFLKPFQNAADVQFTFVPVDGKTQVEWAMSGPSDYPSRVMCTVMNMNRMVGTMYEIGLANIKQIVEKGDLPADAVPKVELGKPTAAPSPTPTGK